MERSDLQKPEARTTKVSWSLTSLFSTNMAISETRTTKERTSKGWERWGSLGGNVPLPTSYGVWGSAVSSPSVVRGKAPGDLERFIALVSRYWCRLCWYKNYFVKFSCGSEPRKTPTTKFLWESGPHGIGAYVRIVQSLVVCRWQLNTSRTANTDAYFTALL